MRPIRLELSGFSTFREPIEVSFEGTDLLAFVGATGSGKSSLIDGIVFALYGSVTRYDDKKAVEPVIHKLCNEARVRIDFELLGRRYTAVRVVRRTKDGATTKEARLELVAGDGVVTTIANGVREMDPAVRTLLGLDVEQFNRTVVLPQGKFATFLHGEKKDRQELLRHLLGTGIYKAMGQRARSRAKENDTRRSMLTDQLDALAVLDDEALSLLISHRDAVAALLHGVTSQLDSMRNIAESARRAQEAHAALRTVGDALDKIAMPDSVTELAPQLVAASQAVAAAEARLVVSRAQREAARAELAAQPDIVALHRQLDALRRLGELDSELAEAGPRAEAAELEAERLQSVLDVAERVQEEVAHRLHDAERLAPLGAVIADLAVGTPCPVCRQTVSSLPDHDVDAEIALAKEEASSANENVAAARKDLKAASKLASTLTADAQRLLVERERAVNDSPGEGVTVDDLELQAEQALAAKKSSDEADKVLLLDEAEVERADSVQEKLLEQERLLREGLTAARDAVIGRAPPLPKGESLPDDWQALVAWAAKEAKAVEKELDSLAEAAASAREQEHAVALMIIEACAEVGVSIAPGAVAKAGEALAAESTDARHHVERAEEARASAAELEGKIAELKGLIDVDLELGRLLDISGFERWLLQAALDDLVGRATQRLFDLSGGQYSLESADGEFSIRDHRNADEVRGVRTLSGGETFLASLALALALSESVADLAVEGGPRIESMFLDEGFGTLDPDSLDLVATSLEDLSAGGRMIGVVTHIRDLADRMPVRFEVTKGATTSTVVKVEV